MSDEKNTSIEDLIAFLREGKEEVCQTKLEAQRVHKKLGNFYYECDRLEEAFTYKKNECRMQALQR